MIAATVAAVALTRGPVAESVTQRSAVVSFRTAAAERAFVVLQNGARIAAGGGRDHVVRLTRLTPGRRYTYAVEAGGGVLASGGFRAAPARSGRFTFAVVGDFGSGNRNEEAVASLIGSWHPDFVLTVGDNAYPLGSASLLDRDVFGPYARVMRASAWFPALGNHDVEADGGRPELRAFHSLGTERWYRFTWGTAAVVVLDSEASVGRDSPQLRFARTALASSSCFRFAAWHRPPWEPPNDSFARALRRTIVPLVEKDGVQVVFAGHLHAYARSRRHHGVVYVAVGTGGAELSYDAGALTLPSARVVQGRFGPCAWTSPVGRRASATRRPTDACATSSACTATDVLESGRAPGAQRSGNSRPRSSSGRGPKMRRSLSSMRRSSMLASRRRIRPCSSNSHSSLP